MILVSGDALFDFFLDTEDGPGSLGFQARAGGSPLNVALGIARLGGQASFFSGLSTDLLGTRLRAMLTAEGVDLRYAVETDRLTTVSLVGLDTAGVPAYAFHSAECADTGLTVEDCPEVGAEITGLHFGSYSIAVEPVASALEKLTAVNKINFLSLDPNVRAGVERDMDVWKTRIAGFFPHLDVFKVSTEDLEILHPGVSINDFAQGALGAGAELVVVTDGPGEAKAFMKDGRHAAATPPKVDVVDTVGAGDTFMASLLHLLDRGRDPSAALAAMTDATLHDTLRICTTAAAITSTRRGADLPTAADLEAALRG